MPNSNITKEYFKNNHKGKFRGERKDAASGMKYSHSARNAEYDKAYENEFFDLAITDDALRTAVPLHENRSLV